MTEYAMAEHVDANGRFHGDDGRFVSLRDYIERLLTEHDRAHVAEHKAVEVQAREYERRLEQLNHAHQEALRVQHTYVSSEKYEDRADVVDGKIQTLEQANFTHQELIAEFRLVQKHVVDLIAFRGRAGLIATGIAVFSSVIGAAIMKALG